MQDHTIIFSGPPPPTNVAAEQDGPTSIRVTWTPPSSLDGVTGYRISYTGGSSGSVTINGGNNNSHILIGLINGETYTLSVTTTSMDLLSEDADASEISLGKYRTFHVTNNCFSTVPGALDLDTPMEVTATAITITGSVPYGSVVAGFMVHWQRDTSVGCSNVDEGSKTKSGGFNSFEITGLQPDSRYNITVTVSNTAGSVNDHLTVITLEAGKREINLNLTLRCYYYSSQLLLVLLPSLAPIQGSLPVVSLSSGRRYHVPIEMER